MEPLTVPVLNAFVDSGRGGNPAGIVLNAGRFNQADKQAIARQAGLSETAFVSPSTVADFKVEFFTPVRQIAQCGHATVATFSYLSQQGLLRGHRSSMETTDGTRSIILEADLAFMEQRAPRFTPPEAGTGFTTQQVLDSLHLPAEALPDGLLPTVVNTGNSFLIVPLRSAAAVQAVQPDLKAIEALSDHLDLIGFYVFSTETAVPGRDAGARMFAPAYGIPEEAATGMAAGPLACYLYEYLGLKKATFLIEQGHLMQPPSPSVLTARLQRDESGRISNLMVGGRAQVSASLEIQL